jgi:DNA (cytosine-5)-methyltransferase 1
VEGVVKPRLLDLFCGAGGATRGYQLAGFHVTGVDLHPQPNYCGDEFHQADALEFPLEGFDAIHASPPCQFASDLRHRTAGDYLDLLAPTRERLLELSVPWVIENVPGAPMRRDLILCGSSFALGAICRDGRYRQLRRHRWFESNVPMMAPPCQHRGQPIGVYGTGGGGQMTRGYKGTTAEYREAMQMPWATKAEIAQAIPPAYAEHVGAYLLAAVRRAVAA